MIRGQTVWVGLRGLAAAVGVFSAAGGERDEARGERDVSAQLTLALTRDEPLLLALAPPAPSSATLTLDAVPVHLREVEVERAAAADYDGLLTGGER